MRKELLVRVIGWPGGLNPKSVDQEDERTRFSEVVITSDADIDDLKLPLALKNQLRDFWGSSSQVLSAEIAAEDLSNSKIKLVAERVVERRRLVVFGAGHVGRSVALIGAMLGLDVTLLDDRQEFLVRDQLSDWGIRTRVVDFEDIGDSIESQENLAIVIVTRGHQCDEAILRQVAKLGAAYVGMIGSRRRVAGVFQRLKHAGISQSFLDKVKAPIGLEIGSSSPQEIAVAIHAEIIKHFAEVR
ncbi:MAG TPA: XdhC family protein [Blastocatellia bacterium]|nr:XdhC family protein [Blastocatellia bacterium]